MKFIDKIKKYIAYTLTLSIISSSFLYPLTTHSQGIGGNATGGVNLQGLGAVATQCVISFFVQRKAQRAIQAAADKVDPVANAAVIAARLTHVPTVDPVVNTTARVETRKVEAEAKLQSFKEECLDMIMRYIVMKVIDKITLMTVDWINSGFQGNPFYPQDRPNFFQQIAREELTSFTGWFGLDPQNHPFGRMIAETLLLSVQNTLQDNFRYSLDRVLQHHNQYATYENFTARFSVGGWAGYAEFARPNNNVFGNYIMANQHLANRVAGTNLTVAANFQKQLSESGGLLNQQICRVSGTGQDDYIERNRPNHLGGYTEMPVNGNVADIIDLLPDAVQAELSGMSPDAQRQQYNLLVRQSRCARWETVTPGRFIAEQTSQVLGSPLRNLELADEWNENVALILDALAAQLFEQGLAAFTNTTGEYSSNPNDPTYNAIWAQTQNQEHGQQLGQPTLPQTFSGEDGFGAGIIQVQQNYLLAAGELVDNLNALVRDIRALDYCVPGPNPAWYTDSLINLQNILALENQPYFEDVIGYQNYYANRIGELFGITINPNDQIQNQTEFNDFANFVLTKYAEAMNERYALNGSPPPSMRPTLTSLFNQILSYQTQAEAYQEQAVNLALVMPQLEFIQQGITSLSPEDQQNPNSPGMQNYSSLFSMVASQGVLVTESQFQQIQTQASQVGNQINFVNTLINNCVNETTTQTYTQQNPTERVFYSQFPSIYDNQNILVLPNPQATHYLSNMVFSTTPGPNVINLNGFGAQVIVGQSSTEVISNLLQVVY